MSNSVVTETASAGGHPARDVKLSTGSIIHYSELRPGKVEGRRRVRATVPVTCGRCQRKRICLVQHIKPSSTGFCPRCHKKKYFGDLKLPNGSVYLFSKRDKKKGLPFYCSGCGETKYLKAGCISHPEAPPDLCHRCSVGTRTEDEDHPSGARILWSKRKIGQGVPANKVKVPFICAGCGNESEVWPHSCAKESWRGLCPACRKAQGHPRRIADDVVLKTGSRVCYSRRKSRRVPIICGLPGCGKEHEVDIKQTRGGRGQTFTGYCQAHPLHEITTALLGQQPNSGESKANDEGLQQFVEAVNAAAIAWEQVKGGRGTLEHRAGKVGLLEIGAALGVPLDREDDVKSRNRVARKLKSLGMYSVFPSDGGGLSAFVKAVAKGVERGEDRGEVARQLWNQRPVLTEAA